MAAVPVVLLAVLVLVVWSIRTASRNPSRAVLIPVTCAALIYYMLNILALLVETNINRLVPIPSPHLQNAKNLSRSFPVADLHCDVLLWVGRDFTKTTIDPFDKSKVIGHVDLPRLRKGHVKLQVFAVSLSLVSLRRLR